MLHVLERARWIFIDVLLAFVPLGLFFLSYHLSSMRLSSRHLWKLVRGSFLALVGLGLLLLGIHLGLQPFAEAAGTKIAETNPYLLLPLGFLLAFIAAYAEPAIRILSFEVNIATAGSIQYDLVLWSITASVALMGLLNTIRLFWDISFQHLVIGGYGLSLLLLLFSDELFIAVAFDAGAVATGPFMVSFVLPFNLGAAHAIPNRSPLIDGFGTIALVGLAPFIVILSLGLIFRYRER